jgi:predicted Fe-Mo cluster-binding NifX family protein
MKRMTFACDDSNGLDASISGHFGRCHYYTTVDTDANAIKDLNVIQNPYYDNHVSGQAPQFIKELKSDVIIAGGMGPKAIDLLNSYGIEVCTGVAGSVRDVLDAYLRGQVAGTVPCAHDHKDSCGGSGH